METCIHVCCTEAKLCELYIKSPTSRNNVFLGAGLLLDILWIYLKQYSSSAEGY